MRINAVKSIAPKLRSESTEQTMFVDRIRHFYPDVLVMAIPNGGMRSKREAARLKTEGVLPGAPDLFIAEPRNGYHGLLIEMKRTQRSSTSKVQKSVHESLRDRGYAVFVCKGVDDAWATLETYLGVSSKL